MWIFVNMIMEIDVWLVIKNRSVIYRRPSSVSKVSRISRESLWPILNLNAFIVLIWHIFVIDWHLLQKSIVKFKFSGKCSRLFIFLSVPGGRILSVEPILKLRNFSFISALFDSWQISFYELQRSVPGHQIELFQFLILMDNKYQ